VNQAESTAHRSGPKFPNVHIDIVGEDGNIFFIIGRAITAMRRGGIAQAEIDEFVSEIADSPSYDDALQGIATWVDVD
jgi:hypothetical protein